MRSLVRSVLVLSAAAAATSVAVPAHAQIFTTSTSATVASQPTAFTQNVTLSRFDTGGGALTLVSIQITLNANAVASLEVENRTPNSSGDAVRNLNGFSLRVPVRVTGPNNLTLTVNTTADSTQFATFNGPESFNPGDIRTFTGPTVTNSGSTNVPLAGFAPYVGGGGQTVQLTLNGRAALLDDVDGDTGLSYTPRANAGGTVTINYSYVVNPEPSALALLAVGIAPFGIVIARRRRG